MPEQSFLYQEIHDQPHILRNLLDRERPNVHRLVEAIRARDIHYVVIAARGTSDNAGRYANYLFGALNGLPVALATPSLYSVYKRPPQLHGALVLGISQSGSSPDIVSVLRTAQQQGALTAAITNFPNSDLAQNAAHVIELHAGEERSIAATKTYASELTAIALIGSLLAGEAALVEELDKMPEAVEAVLGVRDDVAVLAERYRYMNECIVAGRGFNYATAFELALKLKELTYTIAEPYSSADFLHGPLAIIEDGFPAVVFAPTGVMLDEMRSFISVLRERGAETLVISDDEHALAAGRTRLPLLATVPEWLSPITAIVPGQLFALFLAQTRDYDPDHPRGLRKVTRTM